MTVVEYLLGIIDWHEHNVPMEHRFQLCPGASTQRLEEFERAKGKSLPADFCELYRFCDGTNGGAFMQYPDLNSLDQILAADGDLASVVEQAVSFPDSRMAGIAKPVGWSNDWFALTHWDGCLVMDLGPEENGTFGQVFHYIEGQPVEVAGTTLTDFFKRIHEGLHRGDYKWSEPNLQVQPKEWDNIAPGPWDWTQKDIDDFYETLKDNWHLFQRLLNTDQPFPGKPQ